MPPRDVRNQHGQRLIPLPNNPDKRSARVHTAPPSSLVRRRQLTVSGDGDGPVRDPRLDAGVVQTAPGKDYALDTERRFEDYTKIPAYYILRVELGPNEHDNQAESITLRPEQFLLRRITWRVTPPIVSITLPAQAPKRVALGPPIAPAYDAGSGIAMRWGDEFSKFLGGPGPEPSGLLGALCGEVNGFLDMTREVLLAGKQTISAFLERGVGLDPYVNGIITAAMIYGDPTTLLTAEFEVEPQIVEIEFHGIGLLPRGQNYSGGA